MTIRHTDDLCHGPHGDQDQARAMDGLYLCTGCVNGIRRNLTRLPHLYEQLAEQLATGGTSSEPRVSGTPEKKLPINPAIADHRHQIQHDLVWWSVYVADERGIGQPADSRPATTAAWLLRHVEWIAARRECAEELPPVLRSLAGRARALADPDRKLKTGERCRQEGDGERCAGTITMSVDGDGLLTARCDACGPQEPAPYMRNRARGRMVDMERVRAYALRVWRQEVSAATVRSWLARGHIQGEDGWYDLGSVEKYLSGRAAEAEKVGA